MNGKLNLVLRRILVVLGILVIFLGIKTSIEGIKHEKNVMSDLKFITGMDGKEIVFAPWQAKKEKTYYMILPAGYGKSKFTGKLFYDDRFYSIYIDDKLYKNGDAWTDNLKEEMHQLRIEDYFGKVRMDKPFQVLVSESVPAFMVTVEAKDELLSTKEYANKQYVEQGNVVILDEDGNILLENEMERLKVRGNLTSNMDKKPFTFTLSEEVSLFGMSASKNWHLLANATDGSHIRNTIMLDWTQEMCEGYHPSGTAVDLFINGEYQGLYFLTETIEVSENRLKLDKENSVLVEMELDYRVVEEVNYVSTTREHYWVIHEELPVAEQEKEEVKLYLDDIESALYSEEGISEISGRRLEELLDFDSWTDTWLLKEISSDHDLGTTSQFGIVEDWKNRSVLLAGPEWDFDGTFGNGNVPWARNPRNLVAAIPNTKGIESVSQNKWLAQMYCHEEFRDMLIQKFQTEVQPKIARLLEQEIDDYAEAIRRPALLDSLRWIGNGTYYYFMAPEDFALGEGEDYHKYDVLDSHVRMVKNFLMEKEQFLQELWVDGVEFEVIIEEHNEEGMALDMNNDIYTWIPKKTVSGNEQ